VGLMKVVRAGFVAGELAGLLDRTHTAINVEVTEAIIVDVILAVNPDCRV
jgi:hypothetical protein